MYNLLQGLRIVEASAFIAGPSCGLHLQQMGAEVVRIDAIGGGPDFRRWPLAPSGQSLYWEGLNKGKKSVAINLSSPEGRELALAIAAAPGEHGGLFVTNFPVDGFLSYERLKAARADSICVRIMGWADGAPGVDYTVNAALGVPYMTGHADDARPVNHVLPAWDLLAGAYAAFALVSAELDRRNTGQGREVRLPLSDLATSSLSHIGQIAEVLGAGQDRPRIGNDLYGALGRDFVTQDGQRIMVAAITPRQWKGVVGALGLAAEIAAIEEALAVSFGHDEGARFVHRHHIFPLFEREIGRQPLSILGPLFDRSGVTWGAYQAMHDAVTHDPRIVTGNPLFQTLTHPSGETYPASGPAATLAGEARGAVVAAPRLGQHSDEILAEMLGLSAAEIGRLHDKGIVAGAEQDA